LTVRLTETLRGRYNFSVMDSQVEDVETLSKLAEKEILKYQLAHLHQTRRGPAFWPLPDRGMTGKEEGRRELARRSARLGFGGVS